MPYRVEVTARAARDHSSIYRRIQAESSVPGDYQGITRDYGDTLLFFQKASSMASLRQTARPRPKAYVSQRIIAS